MRRRRAGSTSRSNRRMSSPSRRDGSSSGSSAGTTAIPPAGSASIASAFARGDVLDGADELEMLRPDRRDEREGRPRDRAELGDLPSPAHAHLRDEHTGLLLEPQHREREPELVVPAGERRDRRRHGGAQRRQGVLRRRLAGRADDGDDLGGRTGAHRARERRERRLLVTGDERSRPGSDRVVDVLHAGVERDEQVAGAGVARVVVDAVDDAVGRRAAKLAQRERLDLVPRERDHPRAPLRA